MDKKVLERSSSSQNVNQSDYTTSTVVRISVKGTSGNTYKVEHSQGSFFFVSANFLLNHGVVKGLEIDEKLYFEFEQENALLECREKAVQLALMREHGAQELYLKLLKREFHPPLINRVISELKESGLIDDARYAEKRASSRCKNQNIGKKRLVAELISQGVYRETAFSTVERTITHEMEEIALTRAIEKLSRKSKITREKMIQALLQRGFDWSLIREKLDSLKVQIHKDV